MGGFLGHFDLVLVFLTLAIFTETSWAYGNTTKIARVLLTFQFLVIVCSTGLAALSLGTCVG